MGGREVGGERGGGGERETKERDCRESESERERARKSLRERECVKRLSQTERQSGRAGVGPGRYCHRKVPVRGSQLGEGSPLRLAKLLIQ